MVRMRTLSRTLAVVAISSCLLITHTPATPQAPKLDDLRKQLDSIAEKFTGKLGYSLHHLTKNESLDRLGDEMFPTDSSIKAAIMCAGMEKVERGEIGYYDLRPLLKEDQTGGSGFFQNIRPILQINVWINTKGQRVEGAKAEPGCSFDPLSL